MQLAINGATTMKATLAEDIAAAGAAGFEALEIWASKLDNYLEDQSIGELVELFDRAGVKPASINSIEFITFRPPEEYEAIRARCHELCERAHAVGCSAIVVVPSPTPTGAKWETIKQESTRVLRDLSEVAGGYGVNLAFEFLGFSWCSVRTLAQCWDIVQETNCDNVGLVIDTCHFYAGGSDLKSILDVNPDKILIFHINDVEDRDLQTIEDAHRLLPGEGVIPLDDILAHLRQTGYDGLCSIELFRPEYWERDPIELARAAKAATLNVVGKYFHIGAQE
jgi:2-keto-myo-inositol isomerase